eukprot:3100477-Rhodomonas_salina.1
MDRPAVGPVGGAPASQAPSKEAIARCQILASRGNLSKAHTELTSLGMTNEPDCVVVPQLA